MRAEDPVPRDSSKERHCTLLGPETYYNRSYSACLFGACKSRSPKQNRSNIYLASRSKQDKNRLQITRIKYTSTVLFLLMWSLVQTGQSFVCSRRHPTDSLRAPLWNMYSPTVASGWSGVGRVCSAVHEGVGLLFHNLTSTV